MNFNQAILCGNVTRDPEFRTLPSGQPVCSYTVATHRIWTDKAGEKQEQMDFTTWSVSASRPSSSPNMSKGITPDGTRAVANPKLGQC
jgi:single stranded DNA-binding protein